MAVMTGCPCSASSPKVQLSTPSDTSGAPRVSARPTRCAHSPSLRTFSSRKTRGALRLSSRTRPFHSPAEGSEGRPSKRGSGGCTTFWCGFRRNHRCAIHFTPFRTGHAACSLRGSTFPFRSWLKKRIALPRLGLTRTVPEMFSSQHLAQPKTFLPSDSCQPLEHFDLSCRGNSVSPPSSTSLRYVRSVAGRSTSWPGSVSTCDSYFCSDMYRPICSASASVSGMCATRCIRFRMCLSTGIELSS
mmetsp:Transcript_104712/g.312778  ORF Transcript_104712/g.312778 Transcript_104712/m.312778 type:complete len:245 (+) Transcript_104712:461-1195(+)